MSNVDNQVAEGFGDEWTRFDQVALSLEEKNRIFAEYFSQFPWHKLPEAAVGADFGCGSGRWASVVAHRVGKLFCVDASDAALQVARKNLADFPNCSFIHASVGALTNISDSSLDFAYSLGVLHHIPDTRAGIASCVAKLKPGAPFLVYLYYRFDQRPMWFKALWRLSDIGRKVVSKLPYGLRYVSSQVIAVTVYWPFARFAKMIEVIGLPAESMPLSYYRDKSFYVMRTDALDRFGTSLEQRFTRLEIENMMRSAGLEDISFSETAPYWCAVGTKASH
jgi:ubiquinone/menaquinone biosynthesis C-methylase UbiE